MIRTSFPLAMNATKANAVSIPREEFIETFATIQELLAHNGDPSEFIITDPYLSSNSVKVDLRKHLQSLYDRMSEIKQSLTPATQMVKIDFN